MSSREPTPSFHCISTPEVKRAGLKRNQAHSGTNKRNPDAVTAAMKAKLKHLHDPGETELVAPARRLSVCLIVFTDRC